MAARSPFTASQVGNIVTDEVEDQEFLFSGSDDDFDAGLLDDDYDPLEREQGKHTDSE